MIDFNITTEKGYIDIAIDDDYNAKCVVLNAVLQHKRAEFQSMQPLHSRGGFIGDIIEPSQTNDSLVWFYLRTNNENDAKALIRKEIEISLTKLVNDKIIDSFNIININVINRTLYLKVIYQANGNTEQIILPNNS